MNSGHKPQGFTIIEVMIVLAIGSFLFVAAAIALTGDQNQTEFDTGARQIFSQLQAISSDVQNGNYATNTQYTCTSSANGPLFSLGTASEGTNVGCVYVGKALQFNPTTGSSFYYVYSLAGDQFSPNTLSPPAPFPYSATVLDSGLSSIYPPPSAQTISLPDQFRVSKVTYSGNPVGVVNDVIGFYNIETSSLSANDSISNQVFVIPEASSSTSSQQVVTDINNDTTGSVVDEYYTNIKSPVTVCFISPLEPSQFVEVSFNDQSNSTNLTLNYGYTSC
jgi:prepilin-type N-terminal cleavage/methylation domain-containing protein